MPVYIPERAISSAAQRQAASPSVPVAEFNSFMTFTGIAAVYHSITFRKREKDEQ
jgi:hypothetical protein